MAPKTYMRMDKHSKFWSDISNDQFVKNTVNSSNDHGENRKIFYSRNGFKEELLGLIN